MCERADTREKVGNFLLKSRYRPPIRVCDRLKVVQGISRKLVVISRCAVRINSPPLPEHADTAVCCLLMDRGLCGVAEAVCRHTSKLQRLQVTPTPRE